MRGEGAGEMPFLLSSRASTTFLSHPCAYFPRVHPVSIPAFNSLHVLVQNRTVQIFALSPIHSMCCPPLYQNTRGGGGLHVRPSHGPPVPFWNNPPRPFDYAQGRREDKKRWHESQRYTCTDHSTTSGQAGAPVPPVSTLRICGAGRSFRWRNCPGEIWRRSRTARRPGGRRGGRGREDADR
jgi:hypothetical protein